MRVKMIKSAPGAGGHRQLTAGNIYNVPDDAGADLVERGLAIDTRPDRTAANVSAKQGVGPASGKSAARMKSLGNGWYLVAGQKVHGRKKAEAAAASAGEG